MLSNEERRIVLANNLREFADWVERTPEVLLDDFGSLWVTFYGATKDDVVALSKSGGKFHKDYSGNSMSLERHFGGAGDGTTIKYMMSVPRDQVCTAKVVGKRTVQKRDPEAYKNIPMIEVEEDVVEWECTPLLADVEDL